MPRNHHGDIHSVLTSHLQVRGHDWVTAKELAMEVGYPWRVVARAMVRLASHTGVEQERREWISSRYRTRRCWVYRVLVTKQQDYPSWLMPKLPEGLM